MSHIEPPLQYPKQLRDKLIQMTLEKYGADAAQATTLLLERYWLAGRYYDWQSAYDDGHVFFPTWLHGLIAVIETRYDLEWLFKVEKISSDTLIWLELYGNLASVGFFR